MDEETQKVMPLMVWRPKDFVAAAGSKETAKAK